MNKTRRCKVKERKGEFHAWESVSQIVPPSPMVGGHCGGVVSQMFALVEFQDGHIERCEPYDVVFVDKTPLPETPEKISTPLHFKEEKMQCPFCDGENANATIYKNEEDKEYFVYCRRCGIETKDSFSTKAKAVKAFADGQTKKIKGV